VSAADADQRDHLANRPKFTPPAGWPTNQELVLQALQANGGWAPDIVAARICEALAARHRLVSPGIGREAGQ
jgi:hypothetical protein